ncbi:MAG: dTMP kinase [Nitrospirota bacterium]
MGIKRRRKRGILITVEGIEGSGKTTQLHRLAKLLRERGYRVVETREPGGTPLAERIREILLNPSGEAPAAETMTPECEALLILACRRQHVTHVIEPALRQGAVVLCDRFSDSTLAYQGYGRGLDLRTLRRMNRVATKGLTPDLTLLFDIAVPAGLARRRREGELNRMDREARRFHERVRRGFLSLAAKEPRRITVLDGRPAPDKIADKVGVIVRSLLSRRRTAVKFS